MFYDMKKNDYSKNLLILLAKTKKKRHTECSVLIKLWFNQAFSLAQEIFINGHTH